MLKIIKDVFDNDLFYRLCTLEDVDKHFRCVRRVVANYDRPEYRKRMVQSIEEGTAYCIDGTNVFLYYIKETNSVSKGVSFAWVGKPVECAALLMAMFQIEDTNTDFIEFFLHHKSNLQHFRTLVDAESLKGQIGYPKRVVIHIHNLRGNFKRLGIV